ncbi:secretory-abundant heat soluble protein 1-like [Paramacrobiotus metropolitanus]|uniref:secretory-abundant heat soluble protein 1-like n=1 Tax=Paramacrobiotus metropolitanus TaxID=2943436 RepID=UPI002445A615|nr:secretory-abundant heat soluble protein 1-like [Paramacrobiotus metropolitanus]
MLREIFVIAAVCFVGAHAAVGRAHMKNQGGSSDENVAHMWLGKWESEQGSEENFDQLLDAIKEAFPYYTNKKIIHDFVRKSDDDYVHKVKIGQGEDQYQVSFKLNEEGTLHKAGAPEVKFVYKETSGNKLVVQQRVASKNIVLEEIYNVQGDKIMKEYVSGDIRAKRIYRRMNHL